MLCRASNIVHHQSKRVYAVFPVRGAGTQYLFGTDSPWWVLIIQEWNHPHMHTMSRKRVIADRPDGDGGVDNDSDDSAMAAPPPTAQEIACATYLTQTLAPSQVFSTALLALITQHMGNRSVSGRRNAGACACRIHRYMYTLMDASSPMDVMCPTCAMDAIANANGGGAEKRHGRKRLRRLSSEDDDDDDNDDDSECNMLDDEAEEATDSEEEEEEEGEEDDDEEEEEEEGDVEKEEGEEEEDDVIIHDV